MKIGDKTHALIVNDVAELLNEYANDIDVAYLKFGEKKFQITFKCILQPGKRGTGIDTDVGIKFAPEPDVEDNKKGHVDEEQMSLHLVEKSEPECKVVQVRAGAWSRGHGRWC